MNQRRIFGFLWPDPAPVPVDDQAHQTRFVRIGHRGLVRLLLLVSMSLVTFGVGLVGILALTASPTIASMAVLISLLAILLIAVARGWQVGTYVNDVGVRIIRMTRTIEIPWSRISMIESDGQSVIVRIGTQPYSTHISRRGLDYLGRTEAFEVARDRLINWWERR